MPRASPLACLLVVAAPAAAHAWQFSSPISFGCHEQLTREALAAAGYVAPPPPLSADERTLPSSLQFDVSPEDANMFAWSLTIGARFPDEHGHSVLALADLNGVHNALNGQHEHCLRGPDQDGTAGDKAALEACRDFIAAEYWKAVASLDADGRVDPDVREPFPVHVPGAGTRDLPLSQYYVHAGIALHTIQDSFTHLYRTGDSLRTVQSVFNWSDQIACRMDEPTDGHPHESILDKCATGEETPSTTERFEAARTASTEFLEALSTPGNRAARALRLERFLDTWFSLQAGCDYENAYCAHPEHAWLTGEGADEASVVCNTSCAATGVGAWGLVPLLLAFRRRRVRALPALLAGFLLLAGTVDARADDAAPAVAAAKPSTTHQWGVGVRVGASLMNPALALGIEGLLVPTPGIELSLLVESNPWIGTERLILNPGLLNGAVGLRFLVPLPGGAQWRPGFALGLARLQEGLYGIPGGRVGPYLSLRPLGLEVPLGGTWSMVVDALDLVAAVPSLSGIPLLHGQHRVSFAFHYLF